ncbi:MULTISPECIES: filamentous hemagglutinin N-terminal domain-containing protein [unclassified Pseudomonas]|uniref:two-partner secretion domain-containing protein n=1 Tax=unclassified Pseudomonas TaxID=196821 RepID=UPI001F594887|nr:MULTISPECIES: filamentous hemagglutinin N-terminal domain-containing protein [unclassified Pseudomonas]
MDVRQFAFLARQPSAAVKSRSHFQGLPKRGLALILANAMFWQPLLAQADGIVVSAPGTGLAQAGNGVPIVNIAAPNANGLSHNQFHDYNVGANGVILNNATGRTQSTQLGGIIVGNPNFQGTAANIILNEVNGGSPSQLRGYTEVAGQSAHVIVANPYGISCNGCGFINTPQATLTTGKAVIENGQISRYQVDKGTVAIEGAGLNASNVDKFEIITRATTINAQIQAKKLTIVAGRNDVDARTLNATARAADGSQAPDLAIDSSALGGMYVGAVKLVGTEAGVGVRLSGDMVAGGDIQIDAAGNVVMGQTSAGRAVNVKAQSVEAKGAVYAGTDLAIKTQGALTNQQTLAAKDSITLDAGGRLTNNGIIEAGVNADNTRNTQGDVRLTAQSLDNTGKTVIASRDLIVTTGELANQGGTLSAQRDAQFKATSLDNQNQGRILSAGSLGINADQLLNSQGGLVTSTANLTAGIGQLINRNGELSSQAQVTLQLAALDNVAGLVSAGQSLSLNATGLVNNQSGRIAARQALQVVSDSLDNRSGELVATDIGLATGTLDNGGGRLQGDRTLAISSGALSNRGGTLAAGIRLDATTASLDNTDGKLTSDGALTAVIAGQLLNQTGLFAAKGDARLTLGSLDNRQGNLAANTLNLQVNGPLNNSHGTLRGEARLDLTAGQVDNSAGGRISAGTTLNASVASLDQHEDGRLFGQGDVSLDLNGGHLNNRGGVINAPGQLLLSNLNSVDNRGGEVSSSQAFTLAADTLNNGNAKLLSEQALTVRIAQALDNTQGLVSAKALDIHAGSLNNNGGTLSAGDGLLAQIDAALDNRNGKVLARSASVSSGSLDNRQGLLQGDATLNLNSLGLLDNRQGTLFAGQAFDLTAGSLDNSGGKLTSDGRLTALISAQLLNQTGLLSAVGQLQISAASLDNSAKGNLYSQAGVSLDLNHGHLNNQGGLIHAPGALLLSNLNSVDNSGGEISSAQALDFSAASLDNRGGKLLSEQGLLVRIDQVLENTKGLVSAAAVDVKANSLTNVQGRLSARDAVAVQVATLLDNHQGEILGTLTSLTQASLDNDNGLILGDKQLLLSSTGATSNRNGRVVSGQALSVNTTSFDNSGGTLTSVDTLNALISGQLLNQAGLIAGGGQLQLAAAGLENRSKGRITGKGDLLLTIGQFDNRGGSVAAVGQLQVKGTSLDNSGTGLLNSGKSMTLAVDSLDNRDGEVSSVSDLVFNGGQFDNSAGGRLLANGDIQLTLERLNNQLKGIISGQQSITFNAGQLDNSSEGSVYAKRDVSMVLGDQLNNQQGTLRSDGGLSLASAGVNNDGGRISSAAALALTSQGVVSNQNGQLLSATTLTLDMKGAALNNARGLINTPGTLVLKNLSSVGNQKGEISSAHAFTLAAQSLDNSDGKLLSDQALAVNVEQALVNAKGEITAAGLDAQAGRLDNSGGVLGSSKDLSLAVVGALLNTDGEVSSAGVSVIDAMTLSNRNGQVMSDVSLDLTTRGALVNQGGTLGAGKRLQLAAASLDNSQSGSVLSDGSLTVNVEGRLDNQAKGSLLSKGAMAVQAGSLDNRGGVFSSKQAQTLVAQSLDNQAGLVSAVGPLHLTLDTANNSKGRIASQADLDAAIGVLNQQGGELAAQGNLTLSANTLDNREGGLVGALKTLKLTVEQVDNRAGEISGQLDTQLSGQRLDNSGGKVLGGTALQLAIVDVINQAKGLVFAKDLRLKGSSLDNTEGTLAGQQSLAVQLAAGLDNTRGKMSSEGRLQLQGQSIDNTGGRVSSAGDLTISSAGKLLNTGGVIESAQAFNLNSANLDNSQQGLLKSQDAAMLSTGQFNNGSGGRVISAGSLDLKATALNNGGRIASGTTLNANLTGLTQESGSELFSSTELNLDMNQGELNNAGLINAPVLVLKNLGDVNNRHGEISSRNAFILAARSLDNSQGKLLSNQALELRIDQALANVKGSISAGKLTTRSATLDNTDGLISSRDSLSIKADGLLDNQRGSLIGDGAVLLTAATLDNRKGDMAGKAEVTVSTNRIDNSQGKLVSTGALQVTGANLDNRGGLVGATKALKLEVTDIDNRTGELTSNADLVINGQRLDNSDGGQVFAVNHLNLTVDQVINRVRGQLNASGLTLTGSALDNSGGKLLSQQALALDLTGDLTNRLGLLSSEGSLNVKANSLDNTQGSLSSAQGLDVAVTGNVNNQSGEVVTDGGLVLRSASLGNQQGSISGKQAVSVTTGALNNQGGRLNSADTLTLATGQLTNGGSIGSVKALSASVTGLDQQGGKLFSQAGLSLDLKQGVLDNNAGLINAVGPLALNNLSRVDNQAGEISSEQAFTLAAQSLENSNGKLLSNQTLTLRINQALANVKGLIGAAGLDLHAGSVDTRGGTLTSRGDLLLTSDGLLNNQGQGLISAARELNLHSTDINNQNGSLLGGARVVLNTGFMDNSNKGLINSQGALDLTAGNLLTGSGGEVSAKGSMGLKLNGLSLAGGQIVGAQDLTLDLNNADLDNRNGLIAAKGPLALNRVRAINNQNGELSTQQNLSLNLNSLDNTGGKLISSQVLSVSAATLLNQNGLISGWQGLNVSGNSLDNRNNGTLSSRNGTLDVRLDGALLNTGAGALVSHGQLGLNVASLDNRGGILSSAAGQNLTVTSQLNNGSAGLIDSGAELEVRAASLDNQGGTINAQQAMTISASDLNNSGGSVAGNGRLTLDLLGSLNNANGKLASAGALLLQRAAHVNNQGGQIASQRLLTLLAGGIDNSQHGTIAGQEQVAVTTTGVLQNNADGLIYSQGSDVYVKAAGLLNNQGAVQGQSGLNLDINAQIDNQDGKLLAQTGDTVIKANALDNQGGTLASLTGLVDATVSDRLLNGDAQGKGGVVQGQRVNLSAGTLDNQRGHIAAQAGDAAINANHVLNAYGGVYAKEGLMVRGNGLDNSSGQIAAKRIDLGLSGQLSNQSGIIESDGPLAVQASDLINQGGKLRALGREGKTQFQIGNQFDNRSGVIETANTDLSLIANTFQNSGGQLLHTGEGDFDISLPNVTGAGGSIVTRGGLTLNADTWTNSSVIQAGRLKVNVNTFTQTESGQLLASSRLEGNGSHWINNGLIASDGSLSLQLNGGYEGNGRLSSVGQMDLTAAQWSVAQSASIAGGGSTRMAVAGALANAGRITSSADMTLTAGSINNAGTLGSTGNLRLTTANLLNQNGLIFSGSDMALRTDVFTNRFADVYGLGNVSIAKDDNNGQATSINNISATIESGGDLSLAAGLIENRKDVFRTSGGLVSSYIGVQCYSCASTTQTGDSYLVWAQNFKSQVLEDSASASMTAGRNFLVTGGDLVNKASTLSAGNNLSFALQNFTNEGASVGDYTLRRSYDFGTLNPHSVPKFMQTVMNYNRTHDPLYNAKAPSVHTWNKDGVEDYKRIGFEGGRDAQRFFTTYGTLRIQTKGDAVDPSIGAVDGPWEMLGARPFNSTTTGSSSSINAVVQAGGAVSINAAQNLTNSVVRQNVAVTGNGPRGAANAVTGNTAVMVTINRELPPGLAQQQVNPVALPGFSLPNGKNGLFRLSGQAANEGLVSQGNSGAPGWTLSGASIGLAERQQTLPTTEGRTLQLADAVQTAVGVHQVTLAAREASGINGNASTINVAGNTAGGTWQPGRTTGSDMTHIDDINGQTPTVNIQRPNLDLSGLTPGERDTTTPVSGTARPGPNVPGLATGNRNTSVGLNTAGALNIPGLMPLAQDVVTAPGRQTVNRVQGLPDRSVVSQPHKYLIETNPALTDLKQFMSSDYLLSGLGYNPDESAKRLGDGLYEQRLIQQAVVARTGQRFIDGQTSDEGVFRYLMDNAIRSKQTLDLSVGVSLTGAQVAALTHDIVWLEEHEVAGEKVLVPVLYLANADQRLASNGALIAGQDVTLIAGKDLTNAGTLRASNNLSATAGNDLTNSGRIEAGNRLDLLAGNNIVNQSGGVIAGRDVTLTATKGDVINERSLTGLGMGEANRSYYGDSARVEAANDLTIKAARDVINSGSVLKSGADTVINAGRDINIVATEARDSGNGGMYAHSSSVTQSSSSVGAGRDIQMTAGRDLNAIASAIDAKRDVTMAAREDMNIASAANEDHLLAKSKKKTVQEDHVSQVGTTISAGGDVILSAGQNMALISSRVSAGDEAYLVAGERLDVLAAQNSDYSLYDYKKKGSWGSKKTQHDEVTKVVNVGSEVKAGGDVILMSGSDQYYQAAKLASGEDLTLESGGSITFDGVKDLHQESHSKSKSSLSWNSMSGKGNTDETFKQTQMAAKGDIVIKAVDGLHIDVKQVNQQTVSQAIDAMVHADPQMAWLKDAEKRGDVDWKLIQETHESYKYSSSSLGQGAMLAIIIIVTALTAGAASGAIGTTFAGAGSAGSGTAMAAATTTSQALATGAYTAAGWGNAMATAAVTSVASSGAVSVINNKGDLGATFKDITSSNALKGYVTGALTAGLTRGVLDDAFGITGKNVISPTHGFNLSTLEGMAGFTKYSLAEGLLQGSVNSLVNGGSIKDSLASALLSQAGNTAMAAGFNWVGDTVKYDDGSPQKVLAHALMGGLLSRATGSDFKTGAVAAALNEALIEDLSNSLGADKGAEKVISQLLGIVAASAVKGDVSKGAQIAGSATTFNRQLHPTERQLAKSLAAKSGGKYTVEQIEEQLRISTVKDTSITPTHDYIAGKEGMYDTGGNWKLLGDGLYVQNFAPADRDVIAFIKANTDIYSWTMTAETGFDSYAKLGEGTTQTRSGVRDRLTGYALDEKGGYRVPVSVDGEYFAPRYFSCGTAECLASGANLDYSDLNTLRWIKAVDQKSLDTLSWSLGVASVPAGGSVQVGLATASMVTSLLHSYLKDDLLSGLESNALSTGFEKFAEKAGMPAAVASRVSNVLGAMKVWDQIVEHGNEFFQGKK